MSRIIILGDARNFPIIKASDTRKLAVFLSADPGGDKTVTLSSRNSKFTLSSGTLDFNSSNYGTPQEITLTAVANGKPDSIIDYLDATAAGYTGAEKRVNVIYSSAQNLYFKNYHWIDALHIESASDIVTMRNEYIAAIFNGNGIPTNDTPDSITTSYTGALHGIIGGGSPSLTGFSSITKLVFSFQDSQADTYTHIVYHIFSSTGDNKLLFVNEGHGSVADHLMINSALADGYDVIYNSMPLYSENTSDSIIATDHLTIKDLDTGPDANTWTYNPFELYLFDKFMALNYIRKNFSYTYIDTVGISGGTLATRYLAAMDTGIRRSVHNRGILPTVFRYTGTPGGIENHYEGNGAEPAVFVICGERRYNFHQLRSDLDILVCGCSNARKQLLAGHYNDSAVGSNISHDLYAPWLNTKIAEITGGSLSYYMNDDQLEKSHSYYQSDVDEIMAFLNS